jgi:hypothetical protein
MEQKPVEQSPVIPHARQVLLAASQIGVAALQPALLCPARGSHASQAPATHWLPFGLPLHCASAVQPTH